MKKNLQSKLHLYVGGGLLAGVAALQGQSVIFQDQFNYAPGSGEAEIAAEGPWDVVSEGDRAGAIQVIQDSGDVFGYGTSNNYLRIEDGLGFVLRTPQFAGTDVITLSLDFIDQRLSQDVVDNELSNAERLTTQFFASLTDGEITNNDRAYLFSLQNGNEIRSGAGTYQDQSLLRFDVILNNDPGQITYDTPTGTKDLATGLADVWIDGTLAAQDYNFARGSSGDGPVEMYAFQTFSNDGFSVDLDNLTLFEGAHVGAAIPEPSTYALLFGLGVLGTAVVVRRRRRN